MVRGAQGLHSFLPRTDATRSPSKQIASRHHTLTSHAVDNGNKVLANKQRICYRHCVGEGPSAVPAFVAGILVARHLKSRQDLSRQQAESTNRVVSLRPSLTSLSCRPYSDRSLEVVTVHKRFKKSSEALTKHR